MLCFCTRRWFTNKPCVREILRAVLRKKPCIAVLESDPSDQGGGHTEAEARDILLSEAYAQRLQNQMADQLGEWRVEWDKPDLQMPTGQEIVDVLFASAPIIWYVGPCLRAWGVAAII